MIEIIKRPAIVIARSSGGNPVLAMLVVFGFWVAINIVATQVETLIWGSPFPHWVDVVVLLAAIIYAAACVWFCAVINVVRDRQQEDAGPIVRQRYPCGCVSCICEDDVQCQGCGATTCDDYRGPKCGCTKQEEAER